jgi:hypothetical protein
MPAAVLAEIGGRALRAVNGGRTIIIGESVRQESRAIVVDVTDLVGQPVVIASMVDASMIDPEICRQARRYGQRGQKDSG